MGALYQLAAVSIGAHRDRLGRKCRPDGESSHAHGYRFATDHDAYLKRDPADWCPDRRSAPDPADWCPDHRSAPDPADWCPDHRSAPDPADWCPDHRSAPGPAGWCPDHRSAPGPADW